MKHIKNIVAVLLFLVLTTSLQAATFKPFTVLTGGGSGALDAEDGANVTAGDGAFVITSDGKLYTYVCIADSATEASPIVISPDTNAGAKRWHLLKMVDHYEEIHVTVVAPNDLAVAVRDAFPVWQNNSGKTFTILGWIGISGTDNTTLNIEETTSTGASNNTVDAVEIATDGTGLYYGSATSGFDDASIASGNIIWLDFDDTDKPTYVKLTIYGYY